MKQSVFEGFCLKNVDKVPLTEYLYVNIKIEGLYKWGIGFVSNEAIKNFHTEVYDALRNKGFTINRADYQAFSDILTQDGTELDIYMHPMEFKGQTLPEQSAEIIKALKSCNCIDRVEVESAYPLYSISDNDYRNMIYDNAKEIALALLEFRIDIRENWNADFDFAQNARICRINSNPDLFSSNCIDASAVSDIRRACIELLDKGETSHEKIAAEVAAQTLIWRKEIELIQEEIQTRTEGKSPAELKKFYGNVLGYNSVQNNKLEEYMKKYPLTEYKDYIRIAADNNFLDLIKEQAADEVHRSSHVVDSKKGIEDKEC